MTGHMALTKLGWGRLPEQVAAAGPSCECKLGSVHCGPNSTGCTLHGTGMFLGGLCLTVKEYCLCWEPEAPGRATALLSAVLQNPGATCDLLPLPCTALSYILSNAQRVLAACAGLTWPHCPCRDPRAATAPRRLSSTAAARVARFR